VAIIAAVFAVILYFSAKHATEIANAEKQRSEKLYIEAQKALQKFEEEKREREKTEANNLFQKAKNLFSFNEFELALATLKQALEKDSTHAEAKELLQKIENK